MTWEYHRDIRNRCGKLSPTISSMIDINKVLVLKVIQISNQSWQDGKAELGKMFEIVSLGK